MHNQAFIDGQNLHFNTTNADKPWQVDLFKFRVYLREKYHVEKAYYFLGYYMPEHNNLFRAIQEAGFILVFRAHGNQSSSIKKGNVDTDIVFEIMRKLYEHEKFGNVILVSGDGDYFKLVDYLITNNRFEKLLAPNRKTLSSLYKVYTADRYHAFLDDVSIKRKIIRLQEIKKAGSP